MSEGVKSTMEYIMIRTYNCESMTDANDNYIGTLMEYLETKVNTVVLALHLPRYTRAAEHVQLSISKIPPFHAMI